MPARMGARRGYTLVELMVVVIMVGVLATLAVIGVRKYVFAAKTSEAINMIGSIKSAQEAYKDETFSYLNVSNGNLDSLYPMQSDPPGKKKYHWVNEAHPDYPRWRALGIGTSNAVQFGYAMVAGGPNDAIPQPGTGQVFNWPAPNGPWYVVRAVGDQNENGTLSIYVSSSFSTDISAENEGE
jgi:type IV pilus assembly protein PilA